MTVIATDFVQGKLSEDELYQKRDEMVKSTKVILCTFHVATQWCVRRGWMAIRGLR